MHRFSISLMLLTALAGAANVSAQTPVPTMPAPSVPQGMQQPDEPQPAPLPVEERPFWTKRRANLVLGFSGAAAAGFVSWKHELDLRARKLQLETMPAGSNDDWATQYAEAQKVLKDRNFWGGVAIGIGGVTLAYMFSSRSHTAAIRPLPGGAGLVWSF